MGWSVVNALPQKSGTDDLHRYVIIGAPHTSNWDFIFAVGAFDLMGLSLKFTIKKEWMVFPFARLMRSMGAIPIDRTPKPGQARASMVTAMADLLIDAKEDLLIGVTPEATRSRRDKWKLGFYHVAKQANVPILFGFIDYEKKQCGIKEVFYPTDDIDADLRKIMDFYKTTKPKYPELFSVNQEHSD